MSNDKPKTLNIVMYCINGTGLGHITRLSNIASAIRELCFSVGIPTTISFVTTSNAPSVAQKFMVYKVPSVSENIQSDDKLNNLRRTVQRISINIIEELKADILVMDTNPYGAYGEFLQIKSIVGKTVFINRNVNESYRENTQRNNLLSQYDKVIAPETSDSHRVSSTAGFEQYRAGIVHGFRFDQCLSRESARNFLGVQGNEKLVYVSAGGGGDKNAEKELSFIIRQLKKIDDLKILVGYGPLYSGEISFDKNTIAFTGSNIRRYFLALDFAVCAAGYNTFQELLAAQVPSAFYAQPKGMDQQDQRIKDGSDKFGTNLFVNDLYDRDVFASALNKLMHESASIKDVLSKRDFEHGVVNAASEIIKLSSPKAVHEIYLAFSQICLKYFMVHGQLYREHEFHVVMSWGYEIIPRVCNKETWQAMLLHIAKIKSKDDIACLDDIVKNFLKIGYMYAQAKERSVINEAARFLTRVLDGLPKSNINIVDYEAWSEEAEVGLARVE